MAGYWKNSLKESASGHAYWLTDVVRRLSPPFYSLFERMGFSKWESHLFMLSDKERVEKYHQAIDRTVRKGSLVLDCGTGTGFLAFLSAKKGARVYAVEFSDMIKTAKDIAKRNGLENIKFIKKSIFHLKDLPKFDVITSEFVGPAIIEERIIEKTRYLKKFLKKSGRLIPERIEIYAAPVETNDLGLLFWKDFHGVDFSSFYYLALDEPQFLNNPRMHMRMLSPIRRVHTIDFYDLKDSVEIERSFKVDKPGRFCGFVCFYRIVLSKGVYISAFLGDSKSEFKPFFLPSKQLMRAEKGDSIGLSLKSVSDNSKWRWDFELIKK